MIRAARDGDEPALARICVLTGARGGDARGLYADDVALADVYALPYLYGPDGFALVWEQDGEIAGYVVGTADTVAFQEWFSAQWWPVAAARHAVVTAADASLRLAASDPSRMVGLVAEAFPAHLHIDLVPAAQGRGAGRALIDAACALLAGRGVSGVHVVVDGENAGALAFYPRVGFDRWRGGAVTLGGTDALGGPAIADGAPDDSHGPTFTRRLAK